MLIELLSFLSLPSIFLDDLFDLLGAISAKLSFNLAAALALLS